jgi:hypothetical protein
MSAHANNPQKEYNRNCVTLPEIDAISSKVSMLKKALENVEAILLNKRNSLRAAVMRTGKEISGQVQDSGKKFLSDPKQTIKDTLNTVASKGSDVKSWFKNKLSTVGRTKSAKEDLDSGIELQPIKKGPKEPELIELQPMGLQKRDMKGKEMSVPQNIVVPSQSSRI